MFNHRELMTSARLVHEHLEPWIPQNIKLLRTTGVQGKAVAPHLAKLLERMSAVSDGFPPSIVTLTLTRGVLDFLERKIHAVEPANYDKVEEFTAQTIKVVNEFEGNIITSLQEKGRKKDEITQRTVALLPELGRAALELMPIGTRLTKASRALLFRLAFFFSLDRYAEYLTQTLPSHNP
jgi:hypothetical protein